MKPNELCDYQKIQSINSRCLLIGKKDPKLSLLLPENKLLQYIYSYSIMGEVLHKATSAHNSRITLGNILLDYIHIKSMYGIDRPILRENRKTLRSKTLQFCDVSYHELLLDKTLFAHRYKIEENQRKERKAAIEFLDHEIIHSVFDLELALDGDIHVAAIMSTIYPKSIIYKYFNFIFISSRFTRITRERANLINDFMNNRKKYLELIKSKRNNKNPFS